MLVRATTGPVQLTGPVQHFGVGTLCTPETEYFYGGILL